MASVFHQALADLNPFDGPKQPTIPNYKPNTVTFGAPAKAPTSTPAYDPSSDIAALNKEIAAEQANYNALETQIAAQPKLPVYNTTAAWANAQSAATATVDPVYQDKLNQYLQQEQLTTSQNTTAEQEAEADATSTLANQTADNATSQSRAQQDQTTQTGDVNENENNAQTDTGTAFDAARTALLGNVANSGLTTSGIGQNQTQQQINNRNQSETESTEGFDNSRRDIATAATRTFQDLATSNTRNTAAAATTTSRAKQTLQDYIDNANLAEQQERTSNESDEQAAIASATNDNYSKGVQNFIASLIGSGTPAQDVQLAAQVYGGS